MSVETHSVAFHGVEPRMVTVQCALSPGLPGFSLVGLPDKAVSEARERVRAVLAGLQIALPSQRITVNLAPADLPKEGSLYDLPIALAILGALDIVPPDALSRLMSLGELSLSGALGHVPGALPAAAAAADRDLSLICPSSCAAEAAWIDSCDVIGAETLAQIIAHLTGRTPLDPVTPQVSPATSSSGCLSDIRGQDRAKRALEIAAAGGHNLILIGPPGAGKTMLAKRLPTILPPMSASEILETSMIHSVAGLTGSGGLTTQRPFRDPHHGASSPAIIGGGRPMRPGQISLAHNGVLFLDELPEFARPVLDSLRQPLESGEVTVARAGITHRYPARFQLIAAANPCRCGQIADPDQACSRAPQCSEDYLSRISGPLLDRFDLRIEVPPVPVKYLRGASHGDSSATVAARVCGSRDKQATRYGGTVLNAQADMQALPAHQGPDGSADRLLSRSADQHRLTARGYSRVLRVARTIADLDGSAAITAPHIAEALWLRVPGAGL